MTTAQLDPRMIRLIEDAAAGINRCGTAARLGIDERSVTRDLVRACRLLRVRRSSRAALVDAALRKGLITLPEQPSCTLDRALADTLILVARGYTNTEITAELHMSLDGVKSRVKRILRVLHANNRAHAVAVGWQRGLLGRGHTTATAPLPSQQRRAHDLYAGRAPAGRKRLARDTFRPSPPNL
jgi:DNA-binding NarL/FixJ family response regulator